MAPKPRTGNIVRPLFKARAASTTSACSGLLRTNPRSQSGFAPSDVEEVLDVACGTGELLGKLVRRWPSARVVGLPSGSTGGLAIAS
jgi:SAM-dependent methyltransferase